MKPPVPGWLLQWGLTALGAYATYYGANEAAITLIVGACVIAVIRIIEKDRRKG